MILRIYARMFTGNTNHSLALLEPLLGCKPDYRFQMGDLEITGIGDVCLVGGADAAIDPIRDTLGPFIVESLDEIRAWFLAKGATIVRDRVTAPTGELLYAEHPDGSKVEYLQWNAEMVDRFVDPDRKPRKKENL